MTLDQPRPSEKLMQLVERFQTLRIRLRSVRLGEPPNNSLNEEKWWEWYKGYRELTKDLEEMKCKILSQAAEEVFLGQEKGK